MWRNAYFCPNVLSSPRGSCKSKTNQVRVRLQFSRRERRSFPRVETVKKIARFNVLFFFTGKSIRSFRYVISYGLGQVYELFVHTTWKYGFPVADNVTTRARFARGVYVRAVGNETINNTSPLFSNRAKSERLEYNYSKRSNSKRSITFIYPSLLVRFFPACEKTYFSDSFPDKTRKS